MRCNELKETNGLRKEVEDMDLLNHPLLRSIREMNKIMFRMAREDASSIGITVVQLMVLYKLSKKPNIGLNELSDALQLTNSTMSGVVDRLVHAGLIKRERSEIDRRAIVLRLTEEGESTLSRLVGEHSRFIKRLQEALAEISEEDLQHLLRIHQQILSKFQS
jgi:MarR family transcriptional regulator, organic hydroperoxide resistance regulator